MLCLWPRLRTLEGAFWPERRQAGDIPEPRESCLGWCALKEAGESTRHGYLSGGVPNQESARMPRWSRKPIAKRRGSEGEFSCADLKVVWLRIVASDRAGVNRRVVARCIRYQRLYTRVSAHPEMTPEVISVFEIIPGVILVGRPAVTSPILLTCASHIFREAPACEAEGWLVGWC
jgi:hypothetical protein